MILLEDKELLKNFLHLKLENSVYAKDNKSLENSTEPLFFKYIDMFENNTKQLKEIIDWNKKDSNGHTIIFKILSYPQKIIESVFKNIKIEESD